MTLVAPTTALRLKGPETHLVTNNNRHFMTTTPTAAQLIEAIQQARSLTELRRWVGPTQSQLAQSDVRLDEIKLLWNRSVNEHWGSDPEQWPSPYFEKFKLLVTEQTIFENIYF